MIVRGWSVVLYCYADLRTWMLKVVTVTISTFRGSVTVSISEMDTASKNRKFWPWKYVHVTVFVWVMYNDVIALAHINELKEDHIRRLKWCSFHIKNFT